LPDDHKKKFAIQLCKINYEKSAEVFRNLEEVAEFLRVQLERVALAEFSAEGKKIDPKTAPKTDLNFSLNSEQWTGKQEEFFVGRYRPNFKQRRHGQTFDQTERTVD